MKIERLPLEQDEIVVDVRFSMSREERRVITTAFAHICAALDCKPNQDIEHIIPIISGVCNVLHESGGGE